MLLSIQLVDHVLDRVLAFIILSGTNFKLRRIFSTSMILIVVINVDKRVDLNALNRL